MKKFILKVSFIFSVVLSIIIGINLYFLGNTRGKDYILGAVPKKYQTLEQIKGNKIVFIGGSNLSFGLDSERISKYFSRPCYNMGIHASIGLKYYLDNIPKYFSKGDIVVLVPEYGKFTSEKDFYGDEPLAYVLWNIYPHQMLNISWRQFFVLIPSFLDLFNQNIRDFPSLFLGKKRKTKPWYALNAFNEYGDCDKHWDQLLENFPPFRKNKGTEKIFANAITEVLNFQETMNSRGVTVVLLPPVIQKTTYNNLNFIINLTKNALLKYGICSEYDTERYCFDDKLFFNTPYHCTKQGVDKRTQLVIEDLGKYISNTPKSNEEFIQVTKTNNNNN